MMRVTLLGLFFAAPSLAAAIFHVSPEAVSNVTANAQFRTIGEAAKSAFAGDTVLIHSGVYREAVAIEHSGTPNKPITFAAAPAANVIITGVDKLTGWRKEDGGNNIFSVEWPYRFIPSSRTDSYPDDEFHRLIGRTEQVLINGYPLQQTLQHDQLMRGGFYVDLAAKRLYVSPPTGESIGGPNDNLAVEAATRAVLWDCKGEHVVVRGIRFRYAANHAQEGAVVFEGRGDMVEDCIFERMNAVGAAFTAKDQTARRCTFQENGQLGFTAYRADNLTVTDCLIRNNNTKGFNRAWEAGGDKIVLSRNVTLEKSCFIDNHGFGIWFDIGDENCTVQNCLIANNEDAGLFYEISYGLHAHDNVIIGNGLAATAGAWGAQAGIVLSSSANCVVTRNLLVANREGFNFREQGRVTPRIDDPAGKAESWIWTHHNVFRRNVVAYNQDAQTRGWFGVSDERHWPRKLQEKRLHPGPMPTPEPGVNQELPNEVSLEDLHVDLSHNFYATSDSEPLFIWGTNWLRHVNYATLGEVREALNLEKGSRVAPFQFRDYPTSDFRVKRDSPAVKLGCYPRGPVPGVRLGRVR